MTVSFDQKIFVEENSANYNLYDCISNFYYRVRKRMKRATLTKKQLLRASCHSIDGNKK